MPRLFGTDIARLLYDGILQSGGLLSATLIKTIIQRDPADVLKNITTDRRYPAHGFIDNRSDEYRAGTLVREGGQFVSILGASLPSGIIPRSGDAIEIEGQTFRISGVPQRDPAAALYRCAVVETGAITPPVIPVVPAQPGAFSQEFSSEFDRYSPGSG